MYPLFFQQILVVHYSNVRCGALWGYMLNRDNPCLQEAYGLALEMDKSTVKFKTLVVPARSGPGRGSHGETYEAQSGAWNENDFVNSAFCIN